MAKTTAWNGLITGCVLLVAGVGPALADPPPSVATMLNYMKPKFHDVQFSTPAPEEYAACEVKVLPGVRPGSKGGYVLLDGKKQIMRRLFANGGMIDTWSYYKDGVEVYRELDSNGDGIPDQFRWLNGAGMKWGKISSPQDTKIDHWLMISAEEASQEVFAALATGDYARLQALFINQAEILALKLPTNETQRIVSLLKGAPAKFQATRTKLPQLDAKARFVRVESATPNCVPADTNGTDQDQLRFSSRTILFEVGDKDKKDDWVQTGEMIRVNMAWRLIDGPSIADNELNTSPGGGESNPALNKLFDQLTNLDKTQPAPLAQPRVDKAVQDYNLNRVALIEEVLKNVKENERETWFKQIFDNLSAAYQAGHQESLIKLGQRCEQLVKALPGSNLAAYGEYRYLWARYAEQLIGKNAAKVQDEWLDQLAKFAQKYPTAEDTPEALWQLAMGSEYSGKDAEAKGWYQQIYQHFPSHAAAAKAKGSERRLDLIGQPLQLTGPQLGSNAPFNIASLKDKVVVVYYWASKVHVCERDFDTLKRLQAAHAKDMELVCVSLDDNAAEASQFLQKAQVRCVNLYTPGGLDSQLATFYGINAMPHLFLVGKDGKVINRTLQVGDLEIELRKAL